jgi:hypothetical protein
MVDRRTRIAALVEQAGGGGAVETPTFHDRVKGQFSDNFDALDTWGVQEPPNTVAFVDTVIVLLGQKREPARRPDDKERALGSREGNLSLDRFSGDSTQDQQTGKR